MSSFDPALFLQAQQTEVNEARPSIPEGIYPAVIGEINPEKIKHGVYEKGDNVGKPWANMPVPLKLQLPSEVQALGLPPEFQLTDRVFIDLTDKGMADNSKGRNQRQLDYRKATNLNNKGEGFAWFQLTGRTIRVQVKHELYEGKIQERVGIILPA